MQPVYIRDAALVTSMGSSLIETWKKLLAGGTGIEKITRFDTRNYLGNSAACIPDLVPESGGSMLKTLIDRLLVQLLPLEKETLVFTATTKSCIDLIDSPRNTPELNKDLLGASMAHHISSRLNLVDRGINISAACASSTIAMAKAAQAIAAGQAPAALVCSMDLVTEFVFSGFSALRAMSPEPSKPFDRDRNGLTLGEGGAALVLTGEKQVNDSGLHPLAEVAGWGMAGDASHVTAPARDGSGLVRAISKAMQGTMRPVPAISAINAHGTGTVYNDAMELTAFKQIFGQRVPPINSIKGALGHTLGAGGAIEAALGIKMLKYQVLPPTTGLINPEPGAEIFVSNRPIDFNGEYLLTTNSGFGGINAALVLRRKGGLPWGEV